MLLLSLLKLIYQDIVGGGLCDIKTIKVIEFGCGSGANIRYAAKLGLDVYAVDISATAIEYAKAKFKEERISR